MPRPRTFVALLAGVTTICVLNLMYVRPYSENKRRRELQQEAELLLQMQKADEVEALSSIFGSDWQVEDPVERRYSIIIHSENSTYSIHLQVIFSDEYPSNAPPAYELHAPWLRGQERLKLESRIQETCHENIGECLVYQFIDTIKEFLDNKEASRTTDNSVGAHPAEPTSQGCVENWDLPDIQKADLECDDIDEEVEDEYGFNPSLHVYQPDTVLTTCAETDEDVPLPVIHHGEKVYDRKSVFVGHLAAITHKKQVKMVLDSLKENRKIAAATHNIIAYRIDVGRGVFISGCEDDGEIHAGSRMLHLLNIMDARNVIVIVTRWYGGVHLGPDRFKHINNCTRDLLEAHGYIKDKGDKKGPKSTTLTSQQVKKKKR